MFDIVCVQTHPPGRADLGGRAERRASRATGPKPCRAVLFSRDASKATSGGFRMGLSSWMVVTSDLDNGGSLRSR